MHWSEAEQKDMRDKQLCEDAGFTWWEGRAFMEGRFNTEAKCIGGFCDDHIWPPQEQCPEGKKQCDGRCPQCSADHHELQDGVCVLEAPSQNQESCSKLGGYSWHWDTQLCYIDPDAFSGQSAECEALDTESLTHGFHTWYVRVRQRSTPPTLRV